MKIPRPQQQALDIPISPLIDIIFILLFFVVQVAEFRSEQQIAVIPPNSRASQPITDPEPLLLVLDQDGQLSIGDRAVPPERLVPVLRAARERQASLLVLGDKETALQGAVEVLDAAAEAGFTRVGLVTRPAEP